MLAVASSSSLRCCHGQKRLLGRVGRSFNRLDAAAGPGPRIRVAGRVNVRAFHEDVSEYNDIGIDQIRNIGIIAHVDAGKTTTTERMLFHSGRTRHIGNVDHGDTITDFLPMERQRGVTIQSAAVTFNWPHPHSLPPDQQPRTINLIDTPGHQDFRYEVDRCLPILDGAVCIMDAVKGVETRTEVVWSSAQAYRIPRILFVNKLDLDGASFRRSVLEIASRLKTWPLVCQIPLWHKDVFAGVVDVINKTVMKFTVTGGMTTSPLCSGPAAKDSSALAVEADAARTALIETLCEHDDALMDEFLALDGQEMPAGSIKAAIRRLIMDGEARFTPVFLGASKQNVGVQPLLDAVVDYLPSPSDRPELQVAVGSRASTLSDFLAAAAAAAAVDEGASKAGKKKSLHLHHLSPLIALAHVFKVVDHPKRGMISFVRVYHGTLTRVNHMWNSSTHAYERPLNLLHVSAKDFLDIQDLPTGHIGAMTGLKTARTGDTLIVAPHVKHNHPPSAPFHDMCVAHVPEIPPAVAFIAIDPVSNLARKRLEDALARLSREDPSIRWSHDEKTDQLIMSALGLLHLEIARDRLQTHYKIEPAEALWGKVEIEYQEAVLQPLPPMRYVLDRPLLDKAGKAACTMALGPLEDHHSESHPLSGDHDHDHDHDHAGDPPSTVNVARFERNGNIIDITIGTPGTADHPESSAPFGLKGVDVAALRAQLLAGAAAGLARGPRRNAPVRRTYVSVTLDPATDHWGAASTPGHVTSAALHAVRNALREAATAQAKNSSASSASGSGGGGGSNSSSSGRRVLGLLEPFTHVHIRCPEADASAVQHDFSSARGGRVAEVRTPEDREGGVAAAAAEAAGLESARFAAAEEVTAVGGEQSTTSSPLLPLSSSSTTATIATVGGMGRGDTGNRRSSSSSWSFDAASVYAPTDPYDSALSAVDGRRKAARDRVLDIFGRAPLREMIEYDAHMRSMTAGRHTIALLEGGHELMTAAREKALDGTWW